MRAAAARPLFSGMSTSPLKFPLGSLRPRRKALHLGRSAMAAAAAAAFGAISACPARRQGTRFFFAKRPSEATMVCVRETKNAEIMSSLSC